ncbi:hypothetical protein DDD_2307 [Nonlabens dokdonensis DSW-6]|uniref:Uncharacterized protein n=1 Tax=Nonlabens dokdonensis (strain DSM 17205 / KCTC 12402 / DSW-6) TaxID=592029 RepID=L7WBF6_NONDD|nr:hypothetical protein DDD_2307 [Nonlabens dokdonensis DSW-6]
MTSSKKLELNSNFLINSSIDKLGSYLSNYPDGILDDYHNLAIKKIS